VARPEGSNAFALSLLVNADTDGKQAPLNVLTSVFVEKDAMPAVSFVCLGRFFDVGPREVANMLIKGEIKVLDFVPAETRAATRTETAQWRRATKPAIGAKKQEPLPKPPAPGFVQIQNGNTWHRTDTVLLASGDRTFLLGMDDSQYFGCEVPGTPKNIISALRALQPPVVRKAVSWDRQGEWFIVPVVADQVPDITECNATFENLTLYRDDPESAKHVIAVGDADDGRIGPDGTVYAKDFALSHSSGDHPEINKRGWHSFHRNTAISSFSVQGVD
jgi:hypothetical protein